MPRSGDDGRRNVVTVSTEAELRGNLSIVSESRHVVFLNTTRLQLTDTLVIDSKRLILRGNAESRTRIGCPPGRRSAFVLRGHGMELSDLLFTKCIGVSAIVIEGSRNEGQRRQRSVTLRRIYFSKNGRKEYLMNGAAIRMIGCTTEPCYRPRGGAIYAENYHLRIRNSTFLGNNATISGGALFVKQPGTKLVIKNSSFENNTVTWDVNDLNLTLLYPGAIPQERDSSGGAIYALNPEMMVISNSNFSFNCAAGGAAVSVWNGKRDEGWEDAVVFNVTGSLFKKNSVECRYKEHKNVDILVASTGAGGGISHIIDGDLPLRWTIERSQFIDNMAIAGGGLYINGAPKVERNITDCVFKRNVVFSAGGSILAWHAHVVLYSTNISESKATGGGGLMVWHDSWLDIREHPVDPSKFSIIENNTALYGGGILLYELGRGADLSALVLRHNKAFRNGGGIRVDDSKDPVVFRGVTIENNCAVVGGGIDVYATANLTITSHRGRPTVIRDNQAVNGGGLYLEPGHYITLDVMIRDAEFRRNEVRRYEESKIAGFVDEDGENRSPLIRQLQDFFSLDAPEEESIVHQLTELENGQGGGICLNLYDIHIFTIADIVLHNVLVEGNKAVVGGGIYVQFSQVNWNGTSGTKCRQAVIGYQYCRRFVLSNVTIVENKAKFAGGVFNAHPERVILTCDLDQSGKEATFRDTFRKQLRQKTKLDREKDLMCLNISHNELTDHKGEDGADAGTQAESLDIQRKKGSLENFASRDKLECRWTDGNSTEIKRYPLEVAVKDAFGQTIRGGIPDAELGVSLESEQVTGRLRYTAKEGIIIINDTRVTGVNMTTTLIVKSENNKSVRGTIQFSIRGCLPGEVTKIGDGCDRCGKGTYGFDISRDCLPCEKHADCYGDAILVPVDGYWHSTPFSPIMNRCVRLTACKYNNRTQKLMQYSANSIKIKEKWEEIQTAMEENRQSNQTKLEYKDYPQCAEGYTGPLCGSCKRDFGHSFSGECESCPASVKYTRLFTALTILWTFVVIGINCAVTLLSTRMRIELARLEERRETAQSHPRFMRSPPVTERMVDEMQLSQRRTISGTTGITERSEDEYNAIVKMNLDASVQLTETLKILINYLQITSTALGLPVNWRSALTGLLSFQGLFLGVASDTFTAPFECHFHDEHRWPSSVIAIWMRLFAPIGVAITLVLVYIVFWLVCHWTTSKVPNKQNALTSQHLVTSVVVIALVTVSFSFIDTVRELLRAINCVEVDKIEDQTENGEGDDHPYLPYAIHRGENVWAEDTELLCFTGTHFPAAVAGIVGLVMSLGVITFIVLWMPFHQGSKTRPVFVSRYGFLYQAYRDEWYRSPWEAMIMIRKACIAAVVVFSVHLDSDLQASMCVGILIIFQGFQMMAQPFKWPENHEYVPEYSGSLFRCLHLPKLAEKWKNLNNKITLNALESGSLFCSIVIFYSALILNNPNATELGALFMIIFAFTVSIGFVSYMLYRLHCGLSVVVDLKLEMIDPNFVTVVISNEMGSVGFFHKVCHLIRVQVNVFMGRKSDQGRTTSGTVELEPSVSDNV